MKKIFTFLVFASSTMGFAQDFDKNLASAKSEYAGGNLEGARFAMQQMIHDLDLAIGKEILRLLPPSMGGMAANTKDETVSANTGFAGVVIHREYGDTAKNCNIDIMGNSPLIGSLNAILSLPFMGNSGDGTQKVVKVEGYKGILQKTVDSETNQTDFTLQIPLNSTLLTLNVPNSTEAEVIKMANTIPVQQIARMVQ